MNYLLIAVPGFLELVIIFIALVIPIIAIYTLWTKEKNSKKAIIWTIVILSIPILGGLLFLLLNFRQIFQTSKVIQS